ncbi:MAG: carboxypeptidase-like regulatory domain-containing protein [Chitinophagales bacterium]
MVTINIKAVAILFLAIFPLFNYAQTGSISGKMLEADNRYGVTKGTVTIYDESGNQLKAIITDFDGNFTIPKLLPGTYNLTFSATKFLALQIKGVKVTADHATFIADVYLTAANVATVKKKKR